MLDIVVGGQGGDEGKAKVLAYLALFGKYSGGIRVGGSNAGHSIYYGGKKLGLKVIPAAVVNPGMTLYIASGSYNRIDYLFDEINEIRKIENNDSIEKRLKIDYNAVIITPEQTKEEAGNVHLANAIGSVKTGTGIALRDRIMRDKSKMCFAKDCPELKHYLCDVASEVNKGIAQGKEYLLEGTQGFKLSLLHGEFPFVTSRDTTASTFAGEAGIGPVNVNEVYIVFKPYVTRVAPGPLENEITDEKELARFHLQGGEVGTVSKRKRRIGQFEWENAKRAIMLNGATKIAITHIDMFTGNEGMSKVEDMTMQAREFIDKVETELCCEPPLPDLELISYGPNTEEMIKRR